MRFEAYVRLLLTPIILSHTAILPSIGPLLGSIWEMSDQNFNVAGIPRDSAVVENALVVQTSTSLL
jgi:hypothetical protein